MILSIFSIILINILLSLDNIIPILLLADSLSNKHLRNIALLLGLFLGGIFRIILVFFAASIFRFGNIVYIIAGIFLLYISIKGLLSKSKEVGDKNRKSATIYSVVASIGIIDLTLSIDNVAAIVAISQDFITLLLGTILGVIVLFILSFFINQLINRIKGLDIAAYLAIFFLAIKFLILPLGVDFSGTITSLFILLLCLICVLYFNLGNIRGFKRVS